ncbi:G-protein coupled receptor GRL101-like [Patiria miniata]|uniref:G-protein coupled receptor GRL101 n=1 Tax=Patiria miniata TaxID=46514 RepID=A0A913ZMH5_PATMI|nr:G-protein coupled receptor GRL101-like [Patiria miniata]
MTSANRVSLEIEELRPVECNDAEFACQSGLACIPRNQVCDGYPHCPMKGDEFGCGPCDEHQYRCPEGGCIGFGYECDAIPGCLDLWDEMNCFPCGESIITLDLTQTSATLTSPYYPNDYPNNALCIWFITTDVGSTISFRFSNFHTEKNHDKVTIGNGHAPSNDSSIIGSFSSSLTSLAVFCNNHIAWMKFTSDYSITRVGFQVTITQERSEVSCKQNEFECKDNSSGLICLAHNVTCDRFALCPDGSDEFHCDDCGPHNISVDIDLINLNSPRYPDRYPNNHDCIWYIKGQSKQLVTMRIKDFEMEERYDYLEVVFLSNGEDPKELFRLTGADISRRTVTWRHDDGVLMLEMKTDLIIARRGFSILIYHIKEEDLEALCQPDEFHCGNGFCVTNSSRCNGFLDCINYEDELNCDDIFCPGFFKCNNLNTSSMSSSFTGNLSQAQCIPLAQVCDGEENCPESDDEIQCDMNRCPAGCKCSYKGSDLVVHCNSGWDSSTLAGLALITHTLQLSGVNISKLDQGMFKATSHLKVLSLKNNRITEIQEHTFDGLENLLWLDLSNTLITELQGSAMEELSSLRGITIFDVPLTRIKTNAFDGLSQVKTLIIVRHIEGLPPLVVEDNAFQGLDNVTELYVDDHRLCCFFPSSECKTLEPEPPLFMCSELMPKMVLKVFMWILGISALVGNIYVMVWRCRERTAGRESRIVQSFLVFNLAVSDALMGLYMLIIASADAYFGKSYFTVSMEWRTSPTCKFAGFISIIGTEASVFFLTLISIDRFLSIVFPFSHYHLRPKSSRIAVLCVWIGTVIVGLVPTILASDSTSDFYGLSDVCIGLPLMTKVTEYEVVDQQIDAGGVANITVGIPYPVDYRASWFFSIALFLGVNLLCFTVILICYIAIFRRVRASSKKVSSSSRDDEQRLAIKMAAIILTDFVCWVPVIIMGILSQARLVEIPTEAYAWIVVFILPINSSLNPYLYTIADLCYQQQKAASVRRKSELAMKGTRSNSENRSNVPVVKNVTSETQLSR